MLLSRSTRRLSEQLSGSSFVCNELAVQSMVDNEASSDVRQHPEAGRWGMSAPKRYLDGNARAKPRTGGCYQRTSGGIPEN